MRSKTLTILTLIIFTFAAGAFAQDSPAGRDWTATYVRDVRVGTVNAFMNIDAEGKRFTGSTGCNVMNGNVRISGNRVGFSGVITTRRACTRETAPIEAAILSALQKATRYQMGRDRLRLYSGKVLVAEFDPRSANYDEKEPLDPTDQIGLEDRKWTLDSINGAPIQKVEQGAFIVFDPAKGSAGGDTSCNAYGGNYKVNGDKISITQIISTMRACIEDERMNIEHGFLEGLRTADRYEIKAAKLSLFRHDRLLLTFTGRRK